MMAIDSRVWSRILLQVEARNAKSLYGACRPMRHVLGEFTAQLRRTITANSRALDRLPTDAWLRARYEPLVLVAAYPAELGEIDCAPYDTAHRALVAAARDQLSSFSFSWRVCDLRDIAARRPFDEFDPACPSFKARIARIARSALRQPVWGKAETLEARRASDVLRVLRTEHPDLTHDQRVFLAGTARYTPVPGHRLLAIFRKRSIKPNYARQYGPVEVWDVRKVRDRHVLESASLSSTNTSFWSTRSESTGVV